MNHVAENDWPADDQQGKPWLGWLVGGLLVLALVGLIFWAVTSFKGGAGGARNQTVKIAVLPDTPPPPPPKEEKKPEPEKREEKPQPQQEQAKPQVAPPAPQQLKMDGPSGDAPSGFSAGQVTQEYKGGDVGTGQGGGNAMQFAFFTTQLQRHMQNALARNRDIKLGDYRVSVSVWLSSSGEFKRVELLSPSGDDKVDEALRAAFLLLPPMPDVPTNLPQPLRLRITNRMTG